MKFILATLIFALTFSAFAMTEVECTGRQQGTDVRIDIQGRYNQGYFKDATLWTKTNGTITTTRHSLNYRAPWGGLNRAEYSSAKLRVEVDLWPDPAPRWGRTYFGTAWVSALARTPVRLQCRFPFAQ